MESVYPNLNPNPWFDCLSNLDTAFVATGKITLLVCFHVILFIIPAAPFAVCTWYYLLQNINCQYKVCALVKSIVSRSPVTEVLNCSLAHENCHLSFPNSPETVKWWWLLRQFLVLVSFFWPKLWSIRTLTAAFLHRNLPDCPEFLIVFTFL